MNDREATVALMANILACRDWELARERDDFRVRAWEDLDFGLREDWATSRKEEAERLVSVIVPFVLRNEVEALSWLGAFGNEHVGEQWPGIVESMKTLRWRAKFYETGELNG